MKRRLLPLLLAAALLLGGTAACSAPPPPSPSATPEPTATAEPTAEPAKDYKYAQNAFGKDETVMTINGLEVSWGEYFYWMLTSVQYIEMYFGDVTDWDSACPFDQSKSVREYTEEIALSYLKEFYTIKAYAAEMGVSLPEGDTARLDEIWEQDIEAYGGGDEAAFLEMMESTYLSREIYDSLNTAALLFHDTFADMYGESGEKMSGEEVLAAAQEQGYLRAKHILIMTIDETQQPYSDEIKAEKRSQAEDILSQLASAEDKNARFDELMLEFSEDTGLVAYPEGYTFGPGEMVPEFEEGAKALEPGEYSDIIETAYGYHIIMRLAVSPEDIVTYTNDGKGQNLRYIITNMLYNAKIEEAIGNAEVIFTEKFQDLDIAEVFSPGPKDGADS